MIKLSIIIPVYNVEKYVTNCILSCLNQDLSKSEYEIIIINDGSTDNSLNLINIISSQNNNIRIYSQSNMGLSVARNNGLKYAKGEYIWFIDSDDSILENSLGILKHLMSIYDVIAIGYKKIYSNNQEEVFINYNECKSGIDLLKKGYYTPAPFYIIKKTLLTHNNLMFTEGLLHEDFEFTPKMLYHSNNIYILHKDLYLYNIHPNSITTSINYKKSFDLILIARKLDDFIKDKSTSNKLIFSKIIALSINNCLNNTLIYNKDICKKIDKEIYKNRDLLKHFLLSRNFMYFIEGILFLISPLKYSRVYKLLSYFRHK